MKKIISASRRTDIPRYFGRWLAHRRRAGFARFRNVFGGQGETSLAPRDVAGYLFWTKYAHPRLFLPQLRELLGEGVPCVFQFTATGYGRGLEPYIPRRDRVVDNMLALARLLPSPRCLQWRYDPIVVSEDLPPAWHLANFRALAARLEGATEVVNVSLVEPYLRAVRRMADPSARYRTLDPRRHSTVHRRYPDLGQAGDDVARLVAALRDVAAEHGMELRSCSNPELGLAASQCCGLELFLPFGAAPELTHLKRQPTRAGCRCLATVDIGMDATCLGGCTYCYVTASQASAVKNFRAHDPRAPSLR